MEMTTKGNPECHACFGRGLDCCDMPCVCLEDYEARWAAIQALRPATPGLRMAPTDEERMHAEMDRLRVERDEARAKVERLRAERDAAIAAERREGAEAMREAILDAMQYVTHDDERTIRALPLDANARGEGGAL